MCSVGRNRWFALVLCVALLFGFVALPQTTRAVDLPPSGAQAFIQTSGPQTPLRIGDFYTSAAGGNDTAGHEFQIYVPCQWPASLPITFSIFDPEVAEPDPVAGSPILADDEIRNAADVEVATNNASSNTSFTLTAPGGASATKTYTPNGGTNRRWVELETVQISAATYGCGTYSLRVATGGNDDNAYVLRVANDPDCTVTPGTCSTINDATSALLGNTNKTDNPDGVAGTGDEITIGMQRTSFQQYPLLPGADPNQLACQRFYTFVSSTIGSVTFNNFDLDQGVQGAKRVTYYPPPESGLGPITGSVSANEVWNNPPTPGSDANGVPLRGGDTIAINANNAGWWRLEVCLQPANPPASAKNQYIIESSSGVLFLDQPPTPRMTLSKTDGVEETRRGDTLTYVLTFANTSNSTATPGAAYDVQLTDQLPVGTTYQSCAIDAPYTGTCSLSGSSVVYNLNEVVPAGASGTVRVSVRVNDDAPTQLENRAEVTYGDSVGNRYPPATAIDIDRVPASAPPTAVALASFTAAQNGQGIGLAWRTTAEMNSLGFYVLRSPAGAPDAAIRISPLIRAVGSNGGASYQWTDTQPVFGATYWLEELDGQGLVTRYGPVKVAVAASPDYSVLVPMAARAATR